jgi:hypothetical protein
MTDYVIETRRFTRAEYDRISTLGSFSQASGSLAVDRRHKGSLYARAGLADYGW